MKNLFKICFLFAIVAISSCKEAYNPVVTANNSNLLVVEGIINSGVDSTIIKLSRTVIIANKTVLNPETGATLVVESDANETFPLKEDLKKGTYFALALNLNSAKKYRLKISTSKGVIYLSDYVEVKTSPVIDEVNYEVKSDGLQVNLNTHDATNKSIYYRWEYKETWIFHAKFISTLEWDGNSIVPRKIGIHECWGNENSSKIVLGTTSKLTQDVIFKSPITFIPSTSEKLSDTYSILVKQYTLTKEAYEFWQNLKKSTESLGSIFDAQPSQLTGNIHNADNQQEPVIGYISVGTVEQKRIFVSKDKFPNFRMVYPYECMEPSIATIKSPGDAKQYFGDFTSIPIENAPTGVYASSRQCADCTVRGTNKRPAFWQ
ncbi:MAG: DUF4249 domain-containing protein [Pedobacter sp.]|nr:MAG: DUF4249 domain-containing protein [Pedobacter sp.]